MRFLPVPILTSLFSLLPLMAVAQQKTANYDEAAIVPYTLPELLKTQDGQPVKTAADGLEMRHVYRA